MDAPMPAAAAAPMTAPALVIDDFMPVEVAKAMRADIEAHFADPAHHRPEIHQAWNYWFVPGLYTYLKTQPEKVIQRVRVEEFVGRLQRCSTEHLGMGSVTWPFLSLYVNGCSQGLHNDSKNGRFGYVYSLTSPERRTIGGETLLLKEGDLARRNARATNAGAGLYDLIEPRFNRLVLFDDRLVHGVQRVAGPINRLDGRCVMHGHIDERGPIVLGALSIEAVHDGISAAIQRFATEKTTSIASYHGPIVFRFTTAADGRVSGLRVLLDRVFDELSNDARCEVAKINLAEALAQSLFPAAAGEATVTLPVTFGGPVGRRNDEGP